MIRRIRRELRRWTLHDWLWLGWIGAFFAIEIPAVFDAKRGNTLSEAWWWFIGVDQPKSLRNRATRVIALSFTAWLIAHLWTRKV